MTRLSISLAALALLPTHALPQPQQPRAVSQTDRDIRLVQRDYYAIPYAMQLSVLTDAAAKGKATSNDASMADASSLQVSLSNIKTGQTSDIQDRPWTDFVTVPAPDQDVFYLDVKQAAEGAYYGSFKAHWGPFQGKPDSPDVARLTTDAFVARFSDMMATPLLRYVSFTVTLQYQGRAVSYKALVLFSGEDPQTHQLVDLYLQGTRYSDSPGVYRTDRLMVSKWRDIPELHDWLLAHTITDDSCREMNRLCCVNGQCGMRRVDFDRKLTHPIMGGVSFDYPPSMISNGPIALDQNCANYSPPYCACDGDSCVPLVQPYSTTTFGNVAVIA